MMIQSRVEICSCGFGLNFAEKGKKVKGLADHFREHEKERPIHHQQTFEFWSN